ncbi:unnamed protein product [Pleuronectes platessa]|uniref:Uncharacterized protein n=1 Tax=Pleuronectes platessa TaxID=8262 RepID=A0A9N7TQA7_PLEPL|nr:unnamed protein product [Pleuronectes platessa]
MTDLLRRNRSAVCRGPPAWDRIRSRSREDLRRHNRRNGLEQALHGPPTPKQELRLPGPSGAELEQEQEPRGPPTLEEEWRLPGPSGAGQELTATQSGLEVAGAQSWLEVAGASEHTAEERGSRCGCPLSNVHPPHQNPFGGCGVLPEPNSLPGTGPQMGLEAGAREQAVEGENLRDKNRKRRMGNTSDQDGMVDRTAGHNITLNDSG